MAERRRDSTVVRELEILHCKIKSGSFERIVEFAGGFAYGVGVDRIVEEMDRLREAVRTQDAELRQLRDENRVLHSSALTVRKTTARQR